MKRYLTLAAASLILVGFSPGDEQPAPLFPSSNIKKLNGELINTSTFQNDGKPIFISFWATWCKPCLQELGTIAENYDEWKETTGVKVIAVSVDDARNEAKVKPFVQGKRWEFEVYLDPNGDFKRAMNVNNVPHSFLIDGTGKIVAQHNSFAPGDEVKLYEEIKKIVSEAPTEK